VGGGGGGGEIEKERGENLTIGGKFWSQRKYKLLQKRKGPKKGGEGNMWGGKETSNGTGGNSLERRGGGQEDRGADKSLEKKLKHKGKGLKGVRDRQIQEKRSRGTGRTP